MQASDLQAFKWRCQVTGVSSFPPSFKLIRVRPPHPQVSLEELNRRDFSVLAHPVQALVGYAEQLICADPERRLLGEAFNLHYFIRTMAEKYRLNAYHNFTHAFSVQLVHQSILRCSISFTTAVPNSGAASHRLNGSSLC